MAEKVKLSKDGNAIDFVQTENIPTSVKKFRKSLEIEGFYRFIFENDLQKEAFNILERIVNTRKSKKKSDKVEATATAQSAKRAEAAPKIEIKKVAIAIPKKAVPVKAAKPAKNKKAAMVKAPAKKAAPKAAASAKKKPAKKK